MHDHHSHAVSGAVTPSAAPLSLLRMSALGRFAIAFGLSVLIWIAVYAVGAI